ncbi:MAG: hypothetical protein RLZZ393_1265 [Pseudomonadota bacterium]
MGPSAKVEPRCLGFPVSNSPAARFLPVVTSLLPREVLRETWTLFQLSWPTCLPVALVGVTASGVPGAEAAASGSPRGLVHEPQWWALYVASMVLTLACYGAVVHRQRCLASGESLTVLDAMRRSFRGLPASLATSALCILVVALGAALALLPGLAAIVWLSLSWVFALEGAMPLEAMRASVAAVRGRFWSMARLLAVLAAAVLVFVVLAGIFVGVLMAVAGKQGPTTPFGQTLSRLLFGTVIALPVVYLGAALVVIRRRIGG